MLIPISNIHLPSNIDCRAKVKNIKYIFLHLIEVVDNIFVLPGDLNQRLKEWNVIIWFHVQRKPVNDVENGHCWYNVRFLSFGKFLNFRLKHIPKHLKCSTQKVHLENLKWKSFLTFKRKWHMTYLYEIMLHKNW